MLLQTVVSEFSSRFVQTERANIVGLVTLLSYIAALVMAIRLVRLLQRGDHQFNTSLWRWCMGILFTILFPNFLSTIILRQQVSEVVLDAPAVPVKSEHSGYMEEGTMQEWISNGETEKQNQPTSKANNGETELGNTINNPDARPENFGEDLQISNPY
jgi:MFS family permease